MDTSWSITLTGVFVLLCTAYIWISKRYKFFIDRGLTNGPKPVLFFGNSFNFILRQINVNDFTIGLYNHFKKNGGYGGTFAFLSPALFIADKELLKTVTIKDFDHFSDHHFFATENQDSIGSRNLFGLKGQKWKNLRSTLSPAFTANKLKILFPIIDKCGKQVVNHLIEKHQENLEEKSSDVMAMEMKYLFTRFTNDAIASAAFGIEVNSLENPKNEFYLMGKDITDFVSGFRILKFIIFQVSPKLFNIFWPKGFLTGKSFDNLVKIVQETIRKRRTEGIVRHDMIHILLEASEKAKKQKEELAKESEFKLGEIIELTEKDIVGQCVQFFFAGFDTIATALSLTVNQLAENPEAQAKLIEEIDAHTEALAKDQEIDYDFIRNLKYLDMVLSESLRRFPPLAQIDRKCTKRFTIPSSDQLPAYTVEPGDQIILPFVGFTRDPEFFPEPDKFIPERFSDENKHEIDPAVNLPFGIGPRMCIANRYAKMECKIMLYHLLKNFEIVPVEGSSIPLKLTKKSFEVKPDNGYLLGLKKRPNASKYSKV